MKIAEIIKTTIFLMAAVMILTTIYSCEKNDTEHSDLEELESNYQKWKGQSIAEYKIEETLNCYCPFGGKHTITVSGNVITSIKNTNGILIPVQNTGFKTIEELFQFAKTSLMSKPDEAKIIYNKQYGYPEYMYFDFESQMMDEEMGYQITEFVGH